MNGQNNQYFDTMRFPGYFGVSSTAPVGKSRCPGSASPLMGSWGIFATTCDVSSIESIGKLIDFVKEKIGVVHYWLLGLKSSNGGPNFTCDQSFAPFKKGWLYSDKWFWWVNPPILSDKHFWLLLWIVFVAEPCCCWLDVYSNYYFLCMSVAISVPLSWFLLHRSEVKRGSFPYGIMLALPVAHIPTVIPILTQQKWLWHMNWFGSTLGLMLICFANH